MALADLAATQTDNLLEPDQLEDLINEDLRFRDQQLKRLKNEVLDLEDLDDSPSLTSFSLDEFRIDLLRSSKAARRVGRSPARALCRRAARRRTSAAASSPVPCSASAVASRRTMTHPAPAKSSTRSPPTSSFTSTTTAPSASPSPNPRKRSISFGTLPPGNPAPSASSATYSTPHPDGADMSHYDGLSQGPRAIEHTFQKRAAVSLLSGRGGLLPNIQELSQPTKVIGNSLLGSLSSNLPDSTMPNLRDKIETALQLSRVIRYAVRHGSFSTLGYHSDRTLDWRSTHFSIRRPRPPQHH